jgi:hypothetical protein
MKFIIIEIFKSIFYIVMELSCGTPGFRGSPFEKQWYRETEILAKEEVSGA